MKANFNPDLIGSVSFIMYYDTRIKTDSFAINFALIDAAARITLLNTWQTFPWSMHYLSLQQSHNNAQDKKIKYVHSATNKVLTESSRT